MRAFLYIIALFSIVGCSQYQKVVKNGTPFEKLEAAKKYYNKEDYLRAQPLFEELLGLYAGRKEREDIYLYLAYTHYGMGEYLLAGYHFGQFTQTYGLSPRKEEAAYMAALCSFHKTLPTELDQTNTREAINNLQAFINQYPNSEYVDECNQRIDELRQRLLKKVYDNALLYYQLGQYKSAIVACTNALDDYPDMINRERLGYLIIDSHYNYAKNSVEAQQEERYNETLHAINTFNKEYRTSGDYDKEVEKIKERTLKEMKDLNLNIAQNN